MKRNHLKSKRLSLFVLKRALFLCCICFSSAILAQENNKSSAVAGSNDALLDQLIQSKGAGSIVFDASNIKQFWVENSVISENGSIKIDLGTRLKPLKIQLANVDESLDCMVEVIAESSDYSFAVLNSKSTVLSNSSREDGFLHYSLASALFHMEDTKDYSFYLKYSSRTLSVLSIKKIVLTFSKNKDPHFLFSPGQLDIKNDNYQISPAATAATKDRNGEAVTLTGKNNILFSSKKYIRVTDNTLQLSAKIKNTGKTPVAVYMGFIPYAKDMMQIGSRVCLYKNSNEILNVISAEPSSNRIVVDTCPKVWTKGCFLVQGAKEDLSDFPNNSFIPESIVDVRELSNGQAEIILAAPLNTAVKKDARLRIQAPYGAMYMYTVPRKVLQPGEETSLSSSTAKDEKNYEYSGSTFNRGVHFACPILYSLPVESGSEQTIQILDFSISY